MPAYTLISSRDPVDGDQMVHELAVELAQAGHEVALFLVENGTFLARRGVCPGLLPKLTAAGVSVLADDLSLRERGISASSLEAQVSSTPLDTLVDHLAEGRRVAWH